MNIIGATIRDLRDFLTAKRIKREPTKLNLQGAGCASCKPRDHSQFRDLLRALRSNTDFGAAVERIASLMRAMKARGAHLPLPNEVTQNDDRSVTLHYSGVCVRVFGDGVASLLGGTAGHLERGATPALLNALHIIARREC
jgi:hypothetical protein